jgi:acyl carrier protein
VKGRILKICGELCCKEISMEEELIATGLFDSFKLMELICTLEEEFDIIFLPEEITELDHFSCVDHMVELLSKKVRE